MTDDVKVTTETKEENKCFCQSKGFRNFLVTALGTFVGVYSALCLFTALHKPMVPPPAFGYGFGAPMPPAMHCPFKQHPGHYFGKCPKGDKPDFNRADKAQRGRAPFETKRDFDKD